jgi:long-subunit fatty acid transport protein
MRVVRPHVQRDALAGHALERSRVSAASLSASAVLLLVGFLPYAAHSDWTVGAQVGVRHDDNVGNAQNTADFAADTMVGARLSAFQSIPLGDSYSMTLGADLSGESFHRLTGLNNASLEGVLALRKKWGLGAFVPWVRAGVSAGRSDYRDSYRNAWVYRATLAAGRRIDERWNFWADYSYERRAARTHEELVPGLSGDAFSENSHNAGINAEYSLSESISLAMRVLGRHGDVVSTTPPGAAIYFASRALAEDPAFGDEYYAYRLIGTSYGVRVGVNWSPTAHNLIGAGFERSDTRADGGNNYTKSVVEITWNYGF